MSSIMIRNLPRSTELDRKAMSAVRGGTAIGSPSVFVNAPVSVSQENNFTQLLNVFNNNKIGPGSDIDLTVAPTLIGTNTLKLGGFPAHFG